MAHAVPVAAQAQPITISMVPKTFVEKLHPEHTSKQHFAETLKHDKLYDQSIKKITDMRSSQGDKFVSALKAKDAAEVGIDYAKATQTKVLLESKRTGLNFEAENKLRGANAIQKKMAAGIPYCNEIIEHCVRNGATRPH